MSRPRTSCPCSTRWASRPASTSAGSNAVSALVSAELGRPSRSRVVGDMEVKGDPGSSLLTMAPIETPRLRLRLLEVGDAAAFRVMTDDPAITDNVHFLSYPFTIADAKQLILGDGDGRDGFLGRVGLEGGSDDRNGRIASARRRRDRGRLLVRGALRRAAASERKPSAPSCKHSAPLFPRASSMPNAGPRTRRRGASSNGSASDFAGGNGLRTGRKRLVWRPGPIGLNYQS